MRTDPVTKRGMRQTHEATEVAKLAVELCRLNGSTDPKEYLADAVGLISSARQLIEELLTKDPEIKKEPADD